MGGFGLPLKPKQMKIIDVYNKMKYSTRGDNPLVYISNQETTEIFGAVYSRSSRRGQHYVEYKFISPEWNDEMDFEPRKICSNVIRFSRKSNALRFIKLVNAEGEYIDTEKTKVDNVFQKNLELYKEFI
jgi:hypothetical protein